jgi:hypothetical protein
MKLNFDKMKDMSIEELLLYKEKLIEDYISSLPTERQLRLRQLQWKIDGELRKYKDPIAKMNKMVELFWDGVGQLHDALSKLDS